MRMASLLCLIPILCLESACAFNTLCCAPPAQRGDAPTFEVTLSLLTLPIATFAAPADDLSGTSIRDAAQLNANVSSASWSKDYLLGQVDAASPITLDYTTLSGGPVIGGAYAWTGSAWEAIGLQYDPANWRSGKFSGGFSLPPKTSHVAVLFYGFATASFTASMRQAAASPSDNTGLNAIFSQAIQRAQAQLGKATSQIYAASTANVLRQDFQNGSAWPYGQPSEISLSR